MGVGEKANIEPDTGNIIILPKPGRFSVFDRKSLFPPEQRQPEAIFIQLFSAPTSLKQNLPRGEINSS